MKLNKTYFNLIISSLILIINYGCDAFLDVNPKGEVTDKDLFEKEEGYQDALYGIYASIGNTTLYGGNLTLLFPETMARNFTAKAGSALDYLSSGNMDYALARSLYNSVWSQAYTEISYINNILGNLESHSEKEFKHYGLYKGEALTLRAMIHFDLARYFAVDYNSSDAVARQKAIPYVTKYAFNITSYSSIENIYSKCIADLKEAEACMQEDDVLMSYPRSNIGSEFTDCRMTHANKYAAEALLARIYWMKGDQDSAALYAQKVIDSELFPLMKTSDFVQPTNGVINMKETIFGLYSTNYSDLCYSALGKVGSSNMLTLNANATQMFIESQGPTPEGSDLRINAWFGSTLEISHALMKMISNHYIYNTSYSGSSYLGVNLIRIPEMYYIMAESLLGKDQDKAMYYFDEVLASRGMVKFDDRSEKPTLTAEDIYLERRKEFYGEGQQWFNMKRLKKDIVISDNITLDGSKDATYKLLIPTAEDLRDESITSNN